MPTVTDARFQEADLLARAVESVFRKLIRLLVGRISLVKLQEMIRFIYIEETEKKLKEALEERVGLRITLTDLMEQHEKFKKKSDFMNDRLGSLSASLQSMMDQHKTVLKAMRDREDAWKKSAIDRKDQLKILMSLESEVESDDSLEASLDKTNKEMEAIAAIIAAARN